MLGLQDFYPRPPRGGRRIVVSDLLGKLYISIHALREEGDAADAVRQPLSIISIHALREEGDDLKANGKPRPWKFLSTPSARRATGISFELLL